ncbi:hypothetical protein [Streptacidiphilus sp. EB129]|uniref:hypothetical protein n=1 Tax=Streptacidiphilus sp. EB129 TaxID=3156262 RepID=UPI003511B7CC
MVLAGAVVVQCGTELWSLATGLVTVGAAVWTVGRGRGGADRRWELVLVGVMALVLAVGFLPLFLLVALAGRDRRRDE